MKRAIAPGGVPVAPPAAPRVDVELRSRADGATVERWSVGEFRRVLFRYNERSDRIETYHYAGLRTDDGAFVFTLADQRPRQRGEAPYAIT